MPPAEGCLPQLASACLPHFREIATSALPWTDYLIVNELETAQTPGIEVPAGDATALKKAAAAILQLGVRRMVIIHTRFGTVGVSRTEGTIIQPALKLPSDFIQGVTGAGDAFAAGILHGLHHGSSVKEYLHLGICAAAGSLAHPTPSPGVCSIEGCLGLANCFDFASFLKSPKTYPSLGENSASA